MSLESGADAACNEDIFQIALEYSNRINFAMQQNGVPLIDAVLITNSSDRLIEDLSIEVVLENGECESWTGRVARIGPDATYRLKPEGLYLNAKRLATRTEAERTTFHVKLATGDLSLDKTFPVDLLAFDQWPGIGHYPELTAAFVTPNHPRMAELLRVARESLRSRSDQDALDGYQSGSRQRVTQIAEACFHAVTTLGIGYINPPASFELEGQRVRLVDRIHHEKLGTCLDLALLLAGLWEQCGLHPLLLLPEGHAIPGFWTHETHLPEPAIDEPARIRNLIELGEVVPVESTLVTGRGATFIEAVNAARQRMSNPGSVFCAIGIRACRKRGVRPLPLRDDGSATSVDLDAVSTSGTPLVGNTILDRIALADRADGLATMDGSVDPQPSEEDRVTRWQKRLLDLSLRNRLINFRETGRTIRFTVPDAAKLEDMFAGMDRVSVNPKTDGDESFLVQELDAHRVYTAHPPAEMQKVLLNLYRLAKTSIEETGANLLHVAIGMLKWYEAEASEKARSAPLILLPARLYRHATGSGYRYELGLSEEPLRPNVTLLEKLQTDFGIQTAGLEDLPEDESGLDVPLILRKFRDAIKDSSRWEVEESVYLGLFSFNKFLMWKDLQENLDRLKQNRLVDHLVSRPHEVFDPHPFPQPDDHDDQVRPGELLCTRDADSTQLAAVRAAADQRTFVLEGPPGTGKSQTIANIIADSLGRGKRVLFVAEKMAALSVVRRRLEEDGLGPFCLELHSARASKKEVLAQLETAFHAPGVAHPDDWEAKCDQLSDTRVHLNTYVRQLHLPRSTGETLYQLLGRLSRLGDGPKVELPIQDPVAVHKDQLDTWRAAIHALHDRSESIDPPHRHPLRGIGCSQWNFDLPAEAQAVIAEADTAHGTLLDSLNEFISASSVQIPVDRLSVEGIRAMVAAVDLLLRSPGPDARLLWGSDAKSNRQDVRGVIAIGRDRDKQRADLLSRYREEFLEIDHLAHIDSAKRAAGMPGPLRMIFGFLVKRKLRKFVASTAPGLQQLIQDLETAREVKRLSSKLAGNDQIASLVGRHWSFSQEQPTAGHADWDAIEGLLDWCDQFTTALTTLESDPAGHGLSKPFVELTSDLERSQAIQPAARSVTHAWETWQAAWGEVSRVLATSNEPTPDETPSGWLPAVHAMLERWSGALSELNHWCSWRHARDHAADTGLGDLVRRFEQGDLTRDQLEDVFERSFGERWFNAIANAVPAIRGFNPDTHSKTIDRFQATDQAIIDKTRAVVAAKLYRNAPSASSHASDQSELGILRRELQKKRRHLPTRRLVEAMPNLLPRLKPCFLMSPLSIAQYLDAKLPPFDLVIFDEASQIPVWDAIGAIARGTEVMVVGDSKQLPPTSFFNTLDQDNDADLDDHIPDDMESILKECNASGVPSMRLRWHYRSRHESLIAFSNHHYYDNGLHTFPSPEDRCEQIGVTLRYVPNGVYDRGVSRTNRVEADQVVEEVVRMLTDPDCARSIGIVTFNQAQQSLIEDLLDDQRRQLPQIEPYFTNEVDEPVFVKNLENVQGDERDAIIFSVGYGPDQTGKHSMNFGPLNKDGGERRLNVAVTRARYQLLAFSSLRSDQIDLRRTRAVGVQHFKTFLDYADRGPRAIAEAIETHGVVEFDSEFERAVWGSLTDRGWDVDTQVGCAGYRIDLAVRDSDHPGRYLLGIECDGAAYHSAKTARDRDRLRQSVLEGLGWELERVWSTDWRINPDRCVAKIEHALEQAKLTRRERASHPDAPIAEKGTKLSATDEVADRPAATIEPNIETAAKQSPHHTTKLIRHAELPPTQNATRTTLAQYTVAKAPNFALADTDIYKRDAKRPAVNALAAIVKTEGPIVEELALRRLASWFGVQRITDRFRRRFDEIRTACLASKPIRSESEIFWVANTTPNDYTGFRIPGDDPESLRDIEHIPLPERVNAVVYILTEQFGLPRQELLREVAKLFGIQRSTSRVVDSVSQAVDAAVASGLAQSLDEYVSITDDR